MDAAASEQQHCLLLDSAAFPVLLRHPSISSKQQIVCNLLACSKAVADVVTQHCVGLVPLHYAITNRHVSPQVDVKSTKFVAWFSLHAMLAHSLQIKTFGFPAMASSQGYYTQVDRKAATRLYVALGNSLQQAAGSAAAAGDNSGIVLQPGIGETGSSSNPLQLQSYKASGMTLEILAQLPVNRLTSLEWGTILAPTEVSAAGSSGLQSPDGVPLRTALGNLTNLRRLSISDAISATNAGRDMLQALARLQCLTELKLLRLQHSALPLLSHVPAQLRQLQFSCYTGRECYEIYDHARAAGNYRLILTHLTALATLVAECEKDGSPFILKKHDELPHNLQTLIVDDVHSATPLLHPQLVKTLRVLKLSTSEMVASEAAHLSALQPSSGFRGDMAVAMHYRLIHKGLGLYTYAGPRIFAEAAPAWKSIKLLRDLDIHAEPGFLGDGVPRYKCDVKVLQEVEGLQGLTRLAMCHLKVTATVNDVTNLLCQLTNLQSLRLVDYWIVGGSRQDNDVYASYPSDDSCDSADPQLQARSPTDTQQQAPESPHDAVWDQEQSDSKKQSIRLLVLAFAGLPRLHCLGIGMVVVGREFDSMTVEQVERDRQRCMRPIAEELAVQLYSMQGLTELKLYGIGMACCLDSLGTLAGLHTLSLHMGMQQADLVVRLREYATQLTELSELSVYAGSGLHFGRSFMHDIQELFPHVLLYQLDDLGHERLPAVDA